MLKKTTLAVLGLAASGLAMAGTMGPVCAPGNVTVPCEAKKWDLGVQALYLKPAFDADYGYERKINGFQEIDQDWDWGYRITGSYHFSTGNDLTVTWVHFSTDFQQSGFRGVNPLTQQLSAPFTMLQAHTYDQVNAVMGQHVDVGQQKNMRLYAGLQYADIRVDANNNFAAPPSLTKYHNTDFNGVGAVVGTDFSYDLSEAFSLTANGAMSIMYGTGRYSDGFLTTIDGTDVVFGTNYGTKRMIVPSLEAKLGANYAYPIADGVLNIEGGYQAVNYFNALQNLSTLTGSRITNSDYGLFGPYLGAKWVGNA